MNIFNIFIELFTLIFQAGLFFIAYRKLDKMNKINSAEFIHRLKNDFFTDKTRILFHLIRINAIEFVKTDEKEPYFLVKEELISEENSIRETLIVKKIYSTFEVDDNLLGHLEDIGLFEINRIIDIKMVYEEFGYYIENVWENCAIRKYIEYIRKNESKDLYDKLEYIYNKCKVFKKKKFKNL